MLTRLQVQYQTYNMWTWVDKVWLGLRVSPLIYELAGSEAIIFWVKSKVSRVQMAQLRFQYYFEIPRQ